MALRAVVVKGSGKIRDPSSRSIDQIDQEVRDKMRTRPAAVAGRAEQSSRSGNSKAQRISICILWLFKKSSDGHLYGWSGDIWAESCAKDSAVTLRRDNEVGRSRAGSEV